MQGVLIDLDNTLVDTAYGIDRAVHYLCEVYSIPYTTSQTLRFNFVNQMLFDEYKCGELSLEEMRRNRVQDFVNDVQEWGAEPSIVF